MGDNLPVAGQIGRMMDRSVHAGIAQMTGGLSPISLAQAYLDWALHLAVSPGKQLALVDKAVRKGARFWEFAWRAAMPGADTADCIDPLPQDRRFRDPAWHGFPFNLFQQAFLLQQQWWHNATTELPGVSPHHEAVASFCARQILDVMSPANFVVTNPVVLDRTVRSGGANLAAGARHLAEDLSRLLAGRPPVGCEDWQVGRDVAVTPGKVVYRNRLIELIQYAPATAAVRPEPVLIVPAWIMKYYILDLSPENSLVRHLVAQGFTVFMVSWKNPGYEDAGLEIDDYRTQGVMAALAAIGGIVPDARIHATGYCLGGTLLAIAAAAMARDGDDRMRSVSMFAAQTDFTEAGELTLFIDDSEVHFLEALMSNQGYLDAKQMSGAFQLLRSNDLIWSRIVRDYLMGERSEMSDLMAWNADATRMPARMHSQYLHRLFLDNDLAAGRLAVEGRPIALTDIAVPIFAVGTEHDHVAPWRSTYKIHLLSDAEITFVLASGGHNVGIVAPPRPASPYHFRIAQRPPNGLFHDPDTWLARAARRDGSWWPAWFEWLGERSGPAVPPPVLGSSGAAAIADAPGSYVLES